MRKPIDLYELLPAIYRIRDSELGEPLRAILDAISDQATIIQQDIDRLWDNFFIETCADWVVPYIGDLIGSNPLHDIELYSRLDVAKTIYYRRRKGTLPALEELARDVTGWRTRAVAFYELLQWSQNVNHVRCRVTSDAPTGSPSTAKSIATVDVRDPDRLDRLDGAFDELAHSVDVRPFGKSDGWHGIPRVGFFQWRLKPYPLARSRAAPGEADHAFWFSPLGSPMPLFTNHEPEIEETERASEIHVPAPIRRIAFHRSPEDYYGEGKSLAIYKNGSQEAVPVSAIRSADLSDGWREPTEGTIAVDVETGRIAFSPSESPDRVDVDFTYGFSGDIGGGPYDRRGTQTGEADDLVVLEVGDEGYESLQAALQAWDEEKPHAVIRVRGNDTCTGPMRIELPAGGQLILEAGNGIRPTIMPTAPSWSIEAPHGPASLTLNGFLIQRGLTLRGSVRLNLLHCTLVPGLRHGRQGQPMHPRTPSIRIHETASDPCDSYTGIALDIEKCILGPIRLPVGCGEISLRDSIVDGLGGFAVRGLETEYAPPATLERCTLLGEASFRELELASEVLFCGTVNTERRQSGCVRFSYVPAGSVAPRRYRCQPDLALERQAQELGFNPSSEVFADHRAHLESQLTPVFTSTRYGNPSYGQLAPTCPDEIRAGAENGSEIGAFAGLAQPQRAANLAVRMEEYLPFGLESGAIYET